jgi:hypothetical protein
MYDRARRAIQSSDFEFGFELVEDDWELKYPVADPKLASLEQQAIDQARIRQQALAAAAPRAYRHPALAVSGRFEMDEDGGEGFGFSDAAGSDEDELIGSLPGTSATAEAGAQQLQGGGTVGGSGQLPANETAKNRIGSAASGHGNGEAAAGNVAKPDARSTGAAEGAAATGASSANSAGAKGGAGGDSSVDPNAEQHVVVATGATPHDQPEHAQSSSSSMTRGRDWALHRKKPNAVPIRRTIQVVVRDDDIVILADDAQVNTPAPTGKRISIRGDTIESLDQVVAAVQEHIEGWGIAGEGLYWRPVLILNIGPDGQRRADDLNRLLKESGIELRTAKILSNDPQGDSRATRSR